MATITNLNDDIIAQVALNQFTQRLAPLGAFSVSYSADAARRGDRVSIPLVSAITATTTATVNYGAGGGTLTAAEAVIDQHVISTVSLTDTQVANSSAANFETFARQQAGAVAAKAMQTIFLNILATTAASAYGAATVTTAAGNFDFDQLVDMGKALDDNEAPAEGRVAVLNPAAYTALVKDLKNNFNIGQDPVRSGVLSDVAGFTVYRTTAIGSAGISNLYAIAGVPDAIAVAVRILQPQAANEYLATRVVTDENGLALGYRRFYEPSSGTHNIAFEMLLGCTRGITKGLVYAAS